MKLVDRLIQYEMAFLGKPYLWGGDDPMAGFDCSGLQHEGLSAVGLAPPTRTTAQGMFAFYNSNARGWTGIMKPGTLLFFGKSLKEITHIALYLGDGLMLEAGGGGSRTTDQKTAIVMNAFVRIRPVSRRSDLVASVLPRGLDPEFDSTAA